MQNWHSAIYPTQFDKNIGIFIYKNMQNREHSLKFLFANFYFP